MGPEEILIYFWEGAPRPPKRKCDRPKNLEVFLVNFQNMWRFRLERGINFHGSLLKYILFQVDDLMPHIKWIFCHISGGNENKAKQGQLCWAWAGPELGNKAKLSPAKLGLRLSLAIKKVPNAFPISTNYLHSIPSTKKFQFEAISLLVHTFPRVAQAMWWVAQAMCSGLRRLCGGWVAGSAENITISVQLKLGLGLSLAIKLNSAQLNWGLGWAWQ